MTIDPLDLVDEVDRAQGRVLDSAARLDDAAVAAPSRLPGWSRGHVLTHIARNADGLVNLLTWAHTGVKTPQYLSMDQRNADIAAGAGRPLDEHIADLKASGARFLEAAREMPASAWAFVVTWTSGATAPAAEVVWTRLSEIEIHHVDADAGYRPADWPAAFTLRMLRIHVPRYAARDDMPPVVLRCTDIGQEFGIGDADGAPVVSGPAASALAWLIGRSDGADLTVDPPGALPRVPSFG